MAQDLQAENNRLNRLFEKFSSEAKTVSIASVALIVSALALLMAWIAVDSAKDAKIRAEYQDTQIQELREDVAVYRIRYAKLDAWLRANGIPVKEIIDE